MLDASAAEAAAEAFISPRIAKWEYCGYVLRRFVNFPESDGFLFGYGPTRDPDNPNSNLKVGGHAPVFVDKSTGACRLVGIVEFGELHAAGKV